MLRTVSQSEALDLLQRLRGTAEPAFLLSPPSEHTDEHHDVRTPETPPNLHLAALTLAPKATGIALELMSRYPVAYPCLCPADYASWTFDALPVSSPGPPEFHLADTDARYAPRMAEWPDEDCLTDAELASIWTFDSHDSSMDTSQTADSYCDPRLSRVDFQRWTDVQIDDGLAAGAISYYLETDHPIHGLFDADLFLHDLVEGDHNFCSPMLVNAVLGWCCVSSRTVYPWVRSGRC